MFEYLIYWFNSFPRLVWESFLTKHVGSYDEKLDHNVFALEFWWREFFHFSGGVLVGYISLPLFFILPKWVAASIPIIAVGVCIGIKEFKNDASEQPNGWDFKNVVDTLVWVFGTASTVALGFLLP